MGEMRRKAIALKTRNWPRGNVVGRTCRSAPLSRHACVARDEKPHPLPKSPKRQKTPGYGLWIGTGCHPIQGRESGFRVPPSSFCILPSAFIGSDSRIQANQRQSKRIKARIFFLSRQTIKARPSSVPNPDFRVYKKLPNEPILDFSICLQTKWNIHQVPQTAKKANPFQRRWGERPREPSGFRPPLSSFCILPSSLVRSSTTRRAPPYPPPSGT